MAFTLIQTTSLSLKDDSTPPARPDLRKVSFGSSTRLDPPANRIVLPELGTLGDPSLYGATLTVYNSTGATTDEVTVNLPALGWSEFCKCPNLKGYRFRSSGPITRVTIKADTITVKGGKGAWGYTLDEPFQGRVALRLEVGSAGAGGRWCADAPGRAGRDMLDKFLGEKRTLPPTTCPARPGGP